MILEVGKAEKCRFIPFLVKTNMFECGNMGIVLEQDGKDVYLYATNAKCSEIYCTMRLGTMRELKHYKQIVIAYNDHVMLLDSGDRLVVIDYDAEKITTNNAALTAKGSAFWGDEVQEPWQPEYNRMFGRG